MDGFGLIRFIGVNFETQPDSREKLAGLILVRDRGSGRERVREGV